jgi:hypothetical protein
MKVINIFDYKKLRKRKRNFIKTQFQSSLLLNTKIVLQQGFSLLSLHL